MSALKNGWVKRLMENHSLPELLAAIDKLPDPDYRTIMRFRIVDKLSQKAVGEKMGKLQGWVCSREHHAVRRIECLLRPLKGGDAL